ncbi:MAG: shikimate kinase [Congregibacter sp.]
MNSAHTQHHTISLIGMPGVGKSTVGVILAKLIGLEFADTDLAIQAREQRTLQEILEADGHLALRRIEEEVLLEVPIENRVLATGGSVVYSEKIMRRLCAAGPVVFLKADIATLQTRVANNPQRGIASDAGQSFEDIFAERVPLYRRYATHTVIATGGNADAIAAMVVQCLHA